MKKLLALLLPLLLLSGCAQDTAGAVLKTVPLNDHALEVKIPDDFKASVLTMTEELTADAFAASDQANQIFSPLSLWFALGVLRQGAAGETLADLDRLMKLEPNFDPAALVPNLSKSLNFLEASKLPQITEKGGIRLSNGVFIDQKFRPNIKADWLTAAADIWGSESASVDFTKKAETQGLIRDWVSQKTDAFIPDYQASFADDGSAILNIYNVLYLQDHWLTPFDRLPEEAFHAPGGDVTVPFLGGVRDAADYKKTETYQAAAFSGEKGIRVWFLLPAAGASPLELIPSLKEILDGNDRPAMTMVQLKAPLLDVDGGNLSLKPLLIDKGYGGMFLSADLSRMLDGVGAVVDDIKQKTRLQLDEKGFKAAAVTEISLQESSSPDQVELFLDRPFLLVIEYQELPLFIAHITDPSAK